MVPVALSNGLGNTSTSLHCFDIIAVEEHAVLFLESITHFDWSNMVIIICFQVKNQLAPISKCVQGSNIYISTMFDVSITKCTTHIYFCYAAAL